MGIARLAFSTHFGEKLMAAAKQRSFLAVRALRSLFTGGAHRLSGESACMHQGKVVARRRAGIVFEVGAPSMLRHSGAMPPCSHQHCSHQLRLVMLGGSALTTAASHNTSLNADAQAHSCAARTRLVCAGQLQR